MKLPQPRRMLERTEKRFGLKPKRLAADTAYGTGKFLGWLVGEEITPHIPGLGEEQSAGRHLLTLGLPLGQARGSTSAPTASCCTPAVPCTTDGPFSIAPPSLTAMSARSKRMLPQATARKIPRDVHEDARDVARRKMEYKGLRKVARRAKTRRDALRASEDPSWLRAHAAQRSFRCARRVPSCRYRAEPQDPGAPSPRAAAFHPRARLRERRPATVRQLQRQRSPDLNVNSMSHQRVARSKTPTFSTASAGGGKSAKASFALADGCIVKISGPIHAERDPDAGARICQIGRLVARRRRAPMQYLRRPTSGCQRTWKRSCCKAAPICRAMATPRRTRSTATPETICSMEARVPTRCSGGPATIPTSSTMSATSYSRTPTRGPMRCFPRSITR